MTETASEPLRVSLTDPEVIDQTARAALNSVDALDPDVVRRLGGQLAEAISRLGRGSPLPGARIEISTGHGLPAIGDTMIANAAIQILRRQVNLAWETPDGRQMTIQMCPPDTDPCR
jgi:hypothetical protein